MADTQYPAIVTAITADIKAGTGLTNVFPYEPDSLSGGPLIYFILDRFEQIESALQELGIRWIWQGRLLVPYSKGSAAEPLLATYLVGLLHCSGTDLDAGGAIPTGNLTIATRGTAKYIRQGGALFRVADFEIEATEFLAYTYAK